MWRLVSMKVRSERNRWAFPHVSLQELAASVLAWHALSFTVPLWRLQGFSAQLHFCFSFLLLEGAKPIQNSEPT